MEFVKSLKSNRISFLYFGPFYICLNLNFREAHPIIYLLRYIHGYKFSEEVEYVGINFATAPSFMVRNMKINCNLKGLENILQN